ncbi:MAG: flavodoxin [Aquabacterium sp.]|nr:flavodoxin [Aquabacterium sp.]
MKRILVVCYSRSGRTRRVAEAIALQCDADLDWIKDREPRQGPVGYLRSALQALLHRKPWIQPARRPMGDYSLVIIGTPVWAWNIASPVRSYLGRYGDRCRRVAFFCTCGGAGADKVLADLQRLSGKRALATLALPRHVVDRGQFHGAVEQFVRRFNGQRGDSVSGARLAA